jgi:tRNA 2-thiouridine synthesizing protein A
MPIAFSCNSSGFCYIVLLEFEIGQTAHPGGYGCKSENKYRSPTTKEETMNFDKDLDARGLNCPLPILRAKKALTDMQSGQVLRIVSTDLGSVKDFQAFCKQTGNDLLSQSEANNEYTFFLKRK